MRAWALSAPRPDTERAERTVANLIAGIGASDFHQTALANVNALVSAGTWSVYRIGRRCRPVMYLSGNYNAPYVAGGCWRAYRAGLYLRDHTFDIVTASGFSGRPVICHYTADEIPVPEHRDRVYRQHGLVERLSVATPDGDGAILAVNLYRHEGQGHFSDREMAFFEQIASGLLAAVKRHIALTGLEERVRDEPPVSLETLQRALDKLQPKLTGRERDVCVRLLAGMTYDAIAADLGLSVPTVKTYRNRAFGRLGIHFRSELFALCLGRHLAGEHGD